MSNSPFSFFTLVFGTDYRHILSALIPSPRFEYVVLFHFIQFSPISLLLLFLSIIN